MKKDDRTYLGHIVDAITKIQTYLHGKSYDTFAKSEETVDAVVRELEIVGEATSHISTSFLKKHPEIPAGDIVGMRNRLIHEYFGVKKDIIWDTCQEDLPLLLQTIKRILQKRSENN